MKTTTNQVSLLSPCQMADGAGSKRPGDRLFQQPAVFKPGLTLRSGRRIAARGQSEMQDAACPTKDASHKKADRSGISPRKTH
jgi:hypothetical protein